MEYPNIIVIDGETSVWLLKKETTAPIAQIFMTGIPTAEDWATLFQSAPLMARYIEYVEGVIKYARNESDHDYAGQANMNLFDEWQKRAKP